MTYLINSKECINCGVCAAECPQNAISKQDNSYYIDSSKCTNCGICEEFCPVSCIFKVSNNNIQGENNDF